MEEFITYWADTLWLPIIVFLVHKQHRWWTLGLVLGCFITLRLQTEIMHTINFPNGIMGFMTSKVHSRGQIVYSIFYILFLLMAHFSPNTRGAVFMAACLAIFFMAFVVSMFVMVL